MKKILLIDDDQTMLHLLGEFLKDDAFQVISALSGSMVCGWHTTSGPT
jgi:DNA-binding response OmpR family regulator